MKGYKAFEKDFTCKGFHYEVGETYELGDGEKLEICKCGFHFCENLIDVFGYYVADADTRVAEVEAFGDVKQIGTKLVTNKIKILREVSPDEIDALVGKARENTGNWNTGRRNAGSFNSGNRNTGNYNSGSGNTGYKNSGCGNTGQYNVGNRNTGHSNAGCWNTGDWNTGNENVGNCNTGDLNTGHHNRGFGNTGCFNVSNYNSGFFNTTTPTIRLFNKDTDIPVDVFYGKFAAIIPRIAANTLLEKDIDAIKSLPNFDADIFYETTGIKID